jgi:methyltransferase, FkbM family
MSIIQTDFKYGKIFISDKDYYIGQCMSNYGEYCEEEVDIFKQILKLDDVVVEAGANIGCLSLPISQIVGQKGIVYAIEPQQYIYNMLCANVAVNNASNIKPKLLAIADQKYEILMPDIDYEAVNNFGGISIGFGNSGEKIWQDTIDNLFLNLKRLNLIKIDVEGMEPRVLVGALETLKKHRPFIYCENDRPDNSDAVIKLLTEANYKVYRHMSHLFHSKNFKSKNENVFQKMYVCENVLAVPRELDMKFDLQFIN